MARSTTLLLVPTMVMSLGAGLVGQNPPPERQTHTQPLPQQHALAAAPATNNTALTGAVMQKLISDPLLKNYAITVNVSDNGAVQLNGVVPAADLGQRAVEVARTVPGVTAVTSKMLVVTDPFAPPPRLPAANSVPIGVAPTPPAAALSLQSQIADALARQAKFSRVGVWVLEDEVMLLGSVTSKPARSQAEALARRLAPRLPIYNIIWVDEHPLSPPSVMPGGK